MNEYPESDLVKKSKNGGFLQKRDEIDRKLLDILYLDSRMKLADIADQLGLSVGSVHYRIKSLEERGIIKKFTIQIDSEKIGYDLTVLVNLEIKVRKLEEVNKALQEIPEIVSLYNITGGQDILAICRFRNRKHMNDVLHKILNIDHITKTSSHLALQILKEEWYTINKKKLTPKMVNEAEKFDMYDYTNKEIEVN